MKPQAWWGVALATLMLGAAPSAPDGGAEPPPNMERYSLVILKRPNLPGPKVADPEALQRQHIGHLRAMARAGKLVVAGPFDDQTDQRLRGLCLYRASLEEARRLAQEDPAVKAGRLEVEVLTWWVEKGAMTFPIAEAMARPAK
ncbi:MAG TPA: YciI family protein [Myxococcaceae bacterium]|nr:YciI family protein [Myxococcaceae bacterium]